jgi:hypothetical protein
VTLTSRQKNVLSFLVLGLLFALPLRGLLRAQGPPMEEGFMLVFPERVLAGDIPNVDFLHLYGPGSLWVLAGVYKVFGTQLVVERLFALLQQIGVVLGMYGLARYWGRTLALLCGVIALIIIVPPIGLTALASRSVSSASSPPSRVGVASAGTRPKGCAGRSSAASSPASRCSIASTW